VTPGIVQLKAVPIDGVPEQASADVAGGAVTPTSITPVAIPTGQVRRRRMSVERGTLRRYEVATPAPTD